MHIDVKKNIVYCSYTNKNVSMRSLLSYKIDFRKFFLRGNNIEIIYNLLFQEPNKESSKTSLATDCIKHDYFFIKRRLSSK